MIGFSTKRWDLKSIRSAIDKKVAETVARVTSKVYNDIVDYHKPRWSGQYFASWSVNIGDAPDRVYIPSVGRGENGGAAIHYPHPRGKTVLPNYANPYAKGWVSNSAPHAMKVEYEGTPTHPDDGWMIATAVKNNVVLSWKFF